MDVRPSNRSYLKWLPTATPRTVPEPEKNEMTTLLRQQVEQPDKTKLWTPDGSFTFELYTVIDEDQTPGEDS